MNTIITDSGVLQNVGVREIAAYLRGRQWRPDGTYFDTGIIWRTETGSPKIVLPLSNDLDDYAQVIADAIATLSRYEERPQQQILRDIEESTADLIRIILNGADTEDGAVPLEEATQLVIHARDMMLSAACSAVQPRPVFLGRKPAEATDYLKSVRLAQTERGSFVLALRSEVPPLLGVGQTTLFPEVASETSEPFERKVTLTLATALTETRNALQETIATGEIGRFYKGVEDGISANLCEAVAALVLPDRDRDVTVRIAWSPTRPAPRNSPNTVRFSSDVLPILREVARVLKEKAMYSGFPVTGSVVRLSRDAVDGAGEVTIVGFVEGVARRIKMVLKESDYALAIQAHQETRLVSMEGELVRSGNSYTLLSPRDFLIEVE